MSLQIALQHYKDVSIIDVWGRIAADGGASELQNSVAALIAEDRKSILINLAEARYIDSRGLGALVAIHAMAHNSGVSLILVKPRDKIRRLLSLARLFAAFETSDDESAAIRRLSCWIPRAA